MVTATPCERLAPDYSLPESIWIIDIDIGISGLVVEYIVAIDVTRVRFPADALFVLVVRDFKRVAALTTRAEYKIKWPHAGLNRGPYGY